MHYFPVAGDVVPNQNPLTVSRAMKYNAFLSYNQKEDGRIAPAIEKELQRFAKPWFKRRVVNIFRDSSDLSATPNLWGKIEQGLAQSEYLIYMASPGSAASKWCRKEVTYWKENKSMDNFLLLLTDGELVWDDETNDFNWEKSTALPEEACRGIFPSEPLYVDFRDEKKRESFEMSNLLFRDRVVMLAATLHGRAVGDMIGEEVLQHKRTMRIRNQAIGVLSTLLATAIGLGIWSEINRMEAVKQTKLAIVARIESDRQTVSALANTSKIQMENGNELEALLSAVKAGKKLREVPELAEKNLAWYEAVLAVQKAVFGVRERNRLETEHRRGIKIGFNPNGKTILTAGGLSKIQRWTKEGAKLGESVDTWHSGERDGDPQITEILFSPDGLRLATIGTNSQVRFWRLENAMSREWTPDGAQSEEYWVNQDYNNGYHFDFANNTMITLGYDGKPLWSRPDGKAVKKPEAEPLPGWPAGVRVVQFAPGGKTVWTADNDGLIQHWTLGEKLPQEFTADHQRLGDSKVYLSSLAISSIGDLIVSGASNGTVKLWTPNGNLLATLDAHPGEWIESIKISPDNSQIATAGGWNGTTVKIWSVHTEMSPNNDKTEERHLDSQTSPDGNVTATIAGEYDRMIELNYLNGDIPASFETEQHASADFPKATMNVAMSPRGGVFATGGSDGTVKLWDLKGKHIKTLSAHEQYAFAHYSPDGELLLTKGDSQEDYAIKLWSEKGKFLGSLNPGFKVGEAYFSAAGDQLIAIEERGGADRTRVWDFDLDDLLRRGSEKLRDFLANHPDTIEDRNLCDEIDALLTP